MSIDDIIVAKLVVLIERVAERSITAADELALGREIVADLRAACGPTNASLT